MAVLKTDLNLVTFNCRSVKSSINEVKQLCDSNDIVMLQEHWLLPHELSMLSMMHPEFLAVAKSAVNITSDILIGRPYGGTAILYRKNLEHNVIVVDSSDPRVCALKLLTNHGPVLFICVHLPTDTGDVECIENYIATCANITALCEDCDSVHYVIAGDFNCHKGSRFYRCLHNFVVDNKLCMSDYSRLVDAVTYCNDAGTACSWIDHVLCSAVIDELICNVSVMDNFVCSDHKPLTVTFNTLAGFSAPLQVTNAGRDSNTDSVIDWTKADDGCLHSYMHTLDSMLTDVNIPVDALSDGGQSNSTKFKIDKYYASIMSCVMKACCICLPVRRLNPARDYVIPGWNDIVSDKHKLARDAYMAWAMAGKTRFGPEHWLMKRTRAQFK